MPRVGFTEATTVSREQIENLMVKLKALLAGRLDDDNIYWANITDDVYKKILVPTNKIIDLPNELSPIIGDKFFGDPDNNFYDKILSTTKDSLASLIRENIMYTKVSSGTISWMINQSNSQYSTTTKVNKKKEVGGGNKWKRAGIGAGAGLLVGGPVGAVAGAAVGYFDPGNISDKLRKDETDTVIESQGLYRKDIVIPLPDDIVPVVSTAGTLFYDITSLNIDMNKQDDDFIPELFMGGVSIDEDEIQMSALLHVGNMDSSSTINCDMKIEVLCNKVA